MIEFTSKPKPARPNTFLYAVGIFLIGATSLFFYGRHQKSTNQAVNGAAVVEGMVREGNPDFEYYKNKIRLTDVRASLGINFAKSRIAIISGVIQNEGDRELEALEMHIALYDVYKQLSKERTATPLRPDVGIKRPMRPLEKREFTVWIEPIEQLWDPKELVIEITGLKYR